MRICRIYYVLIMLLASTICVRGEGWTPQAWDFDHTWSSSNVLTTSGLYSVQVSDEITITSTTDYYPSITATIGASTDYVGVVYRAFDGRQTNYYNTTTQYYVKSNPLDNRIITNSLRSYTYSATNKFVVEAITNLAIVTLSRTTTGVYHFVHMDVDSTRYYEGYYAVAERVDNIYRPEFFDTYPFRLNDGTKLLRDMKKAIFGMLYRFVDVRPFTNNAGIVVSWTNYFDSYYYVTNRVGAIIATNYYLGNLPTYKGQHPYTSILVSAGLPTNWFDGGNPPSWLSDYGGSWKSSNQKTGYGNVVTTESRIIIYPSVTNWTEGMILTNSIYLYDGSVSKITGTNGQLVSCVYTNTGKYGVPTSIQEGFTEADYGWKTFTNIFAFMVVRQEDKSFFQLESETETKIGVECQSSKPYENEAMWYDVYDSACYSVSATSQSSQIGRELGHGALLSWTKSIGSATRDAGSFGNLVPDNCDTNYEYLCGVASEIKLAKFKSNPRVPYTNIIPEVYGYYYKYGVEVVHTDRTNYILNAGFPDNFGVKNKYIQSEIGLSESIIYTGGVYFAEQSEWNDYYLTITNLNHHYLSTNYMNYYEDLWEYYECYITNKYYLLNNIKGIYFESSDAQPYVYIYNYAVTNGFKYY